MQLIFGEIPEHGDIVDSGLDRRGRLYIEVFDQDLSIARRFYEDKRITRTREQERNDARTN